MTDAINLWEQPEISQAFMIAGWRQWADAGSISSGLPRYLIQELRARKIGEILPAGFYLFQIPGTHDLVRPLITFDDGYPKSLEVPHTDLYFAESGGRGIVILLGDEPHLDIERYVESILTVARTLKVKRIITLGGVYSELPYDKERQFSCMYSLRRLKAEMSQYAVELSNYAGGASIGSFICRRAGEKRMEAVGFYGLVPTYDFSNFAELGSAIRIENDFMAWLGIMRRLNHMLRIGFDLSDLEDRKRQLLDVMSAKVDELESAAPGLGIRDYLNQLSDDFDEVTFDPLDDVWEEELRRLLDDDSETAE